MVSPPPWSAHLFLAGPLEGPGSEGARPPGHRGVGLTTSDRKEDSKEKAGSGRGCPHSSEGDRPARVSGFRVVAGPGLCGVAVCLLGFGTHLPRGTGQNWQPLRKALAHTALRREAQNHTVGEAPVTPKTGSRAPPSRGTPPREGLASGLLDRARLPSALVRRLQQYRHCCLPSLGDQKFPSCCLL